MLLALAWACGLSGGALAASPAGTLVLDVSLRQVELAQQAVYWIDERADRDINTVEAAGDTLPWQPRQAGQRDRIDGKVLWVRFDAVVTGSEHWFLEVASAGVDRVQLSYRNRAGDWVHQEGGDALAVARWPLPGRVPTFSLGSEPGQTTRYWLRVEHQRVDFGAPLTLLREDTLVQSREREQFLLGCYAGLAALVFLAALAHGLALRDRAFLAYALYVALLGTGQLARLGIGAQHLWPEWQAWNETSGFVLPMLSGTAALWFMKVLIEPARFSRVLDLAVWAVLAGSLAMVALDAALASRASLALAGGAMVVVIVMLVTLLAAAWRDQRDPDIRLVALGFLPLLLFALFPISRAFNLLGDNVLTRYGLLIGSMLEMPILYTALRVRSERRRMSMTRAAALVHTDALTGVAHRAGLLQRLAASLARSGGTQSAGALLAVRIANFDAIAEEFGRDTAERAIMVAASHLRRAVTDLDLVARVGHHQFAVLLDGAITAEAALSKAQQVVASGLRQADALPPALTLKFHVAVALLPYEALGAQACLDWALEGLAQIPPDARKLIRPLNF